MRDPFRLAAHGTDVRTEVVAGVTTFLTAAYIVFVNPAILSAAGMDKGALITVTCLVAGLSTWLVGLWANVPFMMAPGMGLNAYFAFSLCLGEGIPWQSALGVVFLSGVLFLVLTWLGVRERIVESIPRNLRLAASVGIGLFITFIGLQNLGLVVKDDVVLVGLGELTGPVLLGLAGIVLMAVLETRGVRGSILLGILVTATAGFVLGLTEPPAQLVSAPASMAPVAFQLDIVAALRPALWAAVFSFMFVDLFDSLGTLLAVSYEAGRVEENGRIPGIGRMLGADAMATVVGSVLGTSTTTTYIESAAGIAEGGRTGLTSVVTGSLFLLALFFSPLIGAVPAYATAPALVIVGLFMIRGIHRIDFRRFDEALPAFLTILLMPLTYSIATGLLFGFLSYVVLKVLTGRFGELNPVLVVIAVLSLVDLLVI
ncbi:MAG: NCS2 family permease [Deferrisomatales bacterium]|nr:NCS2 family permease [Deferrisomatales bacterium]